MVTEKSCEHGVSFRINESKRYTNVSYNRATTWSGFEGQGFKGKSRSQKIFLNLFAYVIDGSGIKGKMKLKVQKSRFSGCLAVRTSLNTSVPVRVWVR